MGISALVMAGGKGTRMRSEENEEKPLLKIGNKPLIEYVLDALKNATKIQEIIVAVSKYTPKTAALVQQCGVKVLNTPGKGFVEDMQDVIRNLNLNIVLTISADIPFITGKLIDEIIDYYQHCGKLALTVTVPLQIRRRLNLSYDYVFESANESLVPAGINVINGKRIHETELEEEVLVIDNEKIAVNINTFQDLKIARLLFQ